MQNTTIVNFMHIIYLNLCIYAFIVCISTYINSKYALTFNAIFNEAKYGFLNILF